MSFLQAVGISGQRQGDYARQDLQDEMLAGQLDAQKRAAYEDKLYRQVVKMAWQHEFEKEQAKEAAKRPKAAVPSVAAPRAPSAPGTYSPEDFMQLSERSPTGAYPMANGGPVPAKPRFSGIYDDMNVSDRMPTIFSEYIQDMQAPGFKHGGMVESFLGDLTSHVQAMADGGMIDEPLEANGTAGMDAQVVADMAQRGTAGGVSTPTTGPAVDFFKGGGRKPDSAESQRKLREALDKRNKKADGGEITNGIGTPVALKHGGSVRDFVGQVCGAKKLVHGGPVVGPGTGTSDSVPAVGPGGQPFALSNGEYVLSADTVRAVGKDKLDALQAKHHKMVG